MNKVYARILVVVLFVLVVCPAWATTYYVDKAGNDSNSCGTAATASSDRTKAKLTFGNSSGSAAVSCLHAGDTLIVGDGTYIESEIFLNQSGTANSPIIIRAENHWQAIVSSRSGCNPNFSLYGNYIEIDDISLVIDAGNTYCKPNSAAGTGVRCWNGNCTVRRIKTDNPSGPNGTIRSHGVKTNFSTQPGHSLVEDSELGAGLEFIGDGDIGRGNHITGGGNWGNGVTVKGGSHNIQIYNNLIDGSLTPFFDAGLILGGVTNNSAPQECYNCAAWNNVIITTNNADGMAFWGASDSAFYNNVLINGTIVTRNGYTSTPVRNTWKNNIIVCNNDQGSSGIAATNTLDYNLFYNCTGVPSQTHPISGNPLFVNPASNWHLQGGSPAINAGVTLTFTDLSGNAVPVNVDAAGVTRTVPWDLGIYDSGSGTSDTTPPSPPTGMQVR